MTQSSVAGQIVILNGPPRSGKSSIARAIQDRFDGVWMNIGVDGYMAMTPERFRPGIGLRPGGERPDLEPLVVLLYRALYDTIAAHSRLGVNVVVDVGHHNDYSIPRGILPASARQLEGLPALFVGVRCPIDVVVRRRRETWGVGYADDGSIPPAVLRFQSAVHHHAVYDLEVDTAENEPGTCAELIRERLASGPPPNALRWLAGSPAPGR